MSSRCGGVAITTAGNPAMNLRPGMCPQSSRATPGFHRSGRRERASRRRPPHRPATGLRSAMCPRTKLRSGEREADRLDGDRRVQIPTRRKQRDELSVDPLPHAGCNEARQGRPETLDTDAAFRSGRPGPRSHPTAGAVICRFSTEFLGRAKIEPALPSAAEQVNSSLVSDASGYSARKRAAANACTNEAGSMGLDTCA